MSRLTRAKRPVKRRRAVPRRFEQLETRAMLAGDLLITELLARNNDGLLDEEGDSSDWLEVHNRSQAVIDLDGWFLTDDPDELDKWRFPKVEMEPGDYLVVFASGKDRSPAVVPLIRDLHATTDASFLVDLADGMVTVQLTLGDANFARDRVAIYIQGTLADTIYTRANDFAERTFEAQVHDATNGQLALRLEDQGGDTARATINALTITPNDGGEPLRFDFGTADSPVHSGFTAVTESDSYSVELGYGWQPGSDVVGRDRGELDIRLHTNFGLSQDGEFLAVVEPDGSTISHRYTPKYPEHREGFSYGIVGANTEKQAFFPEPTPGRPNGEAIGGFVADIKFDGDPQFFHGRGFYETPFAVNVTTATPGATLVYTTDGRKPSLMNGTVVGAPDDQTPPTAMIQIETTSTLRVIALMDGLEPTSVRTQTYIFAQDVIQQSTMQREGVYFGMDPGIVGDHSATIVDDLKSLPTLSLVGDEEGWFGRERGIYTNWQRTGRSWERPVSIEYFDPSQPERQFQVDAGVRIQGNTTRAAAQKNLRLHFRSEYGTPKLRFPLFRDSAVETFERITLGFTGTDWLGPVARNVTMAKDRFVHQTLLDVGQPAPHGDAVHLYINGLYWGLYWATERPDHSFAAQYFGGDEDDWDVVRFAGGDGFTVVNGNRDAWNQMVYAAQANLADDDRYEAIQEYLDIDSLIDFMIVNFHIGPGNWEFYGARRRAPGEGFKFFTWDSDSAFGAGQDYTLSTFVIDHNQPAYLFQELRANAQFRQRFADRVHKHLFYDGALTTEAMQARWKAITDRIEKAMVPESARWGTVPGNASGIFTRDGSWRPDVNDVLHDVIPERVAMSFEDFRSAGLYPEFDAPVFNPHGGRIVPGLQLTMDGPEDLFFTVDDSDPRRDFVMFDVVTLLEEGAPARALVPSDGSLGMSWKDQDFDDSSWAEGVTGVGFDKDSIFDPFIGLDTESHMFGMNDSAYIRISFEVIDTSDFAELILRMKYDDGFVAYLNGQEVASRNAPEDPLWNSPATGGHSDSHARRFEDIDITPRLDFLRPGNNILAIQGLNENTSSDDFLIVPQLQAHIITDDGLSPGAMRYTGPITLSENTVVKARAVVGTQWSAVNEAQFTAGPPALRVSEIMFHPQAPPQGSPFADNDFEFVELVNVSPTDSINLENIAFTQGIGFTFPQMSLAPGQHVVVVRDQAAFQQRYGTEVPIAGEYGNTPEDYKLSNRGETLCLEDARGQLIQQFNYDDTWYPATDGEGFSLEVVDPAQPDLAVWSEKTNWLASLRTGGTPGTSPASREILSGDMNLDGVVNHDDINGLVLGLKSPTQYQDTYGVPSALHGDTDGDGDLDFDDIAAFLKLTN